MNGLDIEEFFDELYLNACNEGATHGLPVAALALAFAAFQKRRREQESQAFKLVRRRLEKKLMRRWTRKPNTNGES